MSDDIFRTALALAATCAMLGVASGILIGSRMAESIEREQAIAANAAQYTVSPATGDVRFVYGCQTTGER